MTKSTEKVLVVGDWVIDENWVIAGFESDTSSHIGTDHFRSAINSPRAQTLGLCGAGNVARSLHGLHQKEVENNEHVKAAIQVYGLGLWHYGDTKLIASLFSNDIMANETPLTLAGIHPTGESDETTRYSLCGKPMGAGICRSQSEGGQCPNEGDNKCSYLTTLIDETSRKTCVTVRAIRMYYASAGMEPRLKYRMDWELSRPETPTDEEIEPVVKSLPPDINHIVVSDHHHGCVTDCLTTRLKEKYPDAFWYIRTKNMDVSWVDSIEAEKLRLRMIGADYVPNRSKAKRWFHGKEISNKAIVELLDLGRFDNVPKGTERWIISLHDDNSMLALHKRPDSKRINAIALVDDSARSAINVGRTSIVFASCVASLLHCYSEKSDEVILSRASRQGHLWSKSYVGSVKSNGSTAREYPRLVGDHANAIKPPEGRQDQAPIPTTAVLGDIEEIQNKWSDAFADYGIVNGQFHIWRGYTSIDGYIAIRNRVRDNLDDLYQAVRRFLDTSRGDSSLNCLLLGDPGFGKTFLVRQLAKALRLTPLFFNLAHLTSLDQVIDCFDAISSLQNQRETQPILVFFDEVDAEISSQETYSLFLSPMTDGTYRRGSHVFRLAPCVWMFAGVHIRTTGSRSKGRDFVSRINGPTVHLNCTKRETDDPERKTEQVYWGVKLLRQTFYDVSKISEDVLEFFYDLKLLGGPRSLRTVVRGFRNIQYGEVRNKNLPDFEDVRKLLVPPLVEKENYEARLKRSDPDPLVDIVEDPPASFDSAD
ncbi:MAG: ATP-binding protein [Candidatus Zixiibacteriota bacterium]|nr:MAG: ATP-binding protein [candidate division Zixibacteria bacterium]